MSINSQLLKILILGGRPKCVIDVNLVIWKVINLELRYKNLNE